MEIESNKTISTSSIIPNWSWYQGQTTKVVTVTKEYDENGNLIKETTVTTETTQPHQQQDYRPYVIWSTYN